MARRKRRKHHEHPPHLDEKWLVSYSDLMTLLFGLFVMLYSFAMKNKAVRESIEKELRKVSEKGFKSAAASPVEVEENLEEKELQKVIAQLRRDVNSLQDQLAQAQSQVSTQDLANMQLKKDLMESKLKSATLAKKVITESRSPSATAPAKAIGGASSVMVYVRWENRNHDIDMSVVTPDHQELNFKNRKVSENDPDEFVSDSDSGPGMELFKTTAAKDGEYEFHISLYNSRGDESDSPVQLFIMVNGQEQLIEKFTLKDEDNKRSYSKRLNLKKFGL